ncbi:MAG: glycosyltransferase, partial [Thermoplasmata archaeon]|nr:glycosyltransferase [Thermoplasmata archaeon]
LSPSMFLKEYFENNGIPREKVRYSRYGFRTDRITRKNRIYTRNSKVTFGFMGRVIPVKGIHILVKAFGKLSAKNRKNTNNMRNCRLQIFGDAGPLRKYLNGYASENVIFRGGYKNWEIDSVLGEIDVLVVPSIWYENSPLVIQEAFLAGIPVITSNIGGMAELVKDGVNGLTFEVGDVDDLGNKMERILADPTILNDLKPDRHSVRTIEDDATGVMDAYREVLNR